MHIDRQTRHGHTQAYAQVHAHMHAYAHIQAHMYICVDTLNVTVGVHLTGAAQAAFN